MFDPITEIQIKRTIFTYNTNKNKTDNVDKAQEKQSFLYTLNGNTDL